MSSLGLDPDALTLTSVEGLAASIRRASSFLCPTTPRSLVRAIRDALSGLPGVDQAEIVSELDTVVEALVSYGDLIELPLDDVGGTRRHLFLGGPAYVRRQHGCILVGIRPEGMPLVSEELAESVEYRRHTRLIRSDDPAALEETLDTEGLIKLTSEQWLKAPRKCTPEEHIGVYVDRLEAAGQGGDIEGLRLIDPTADVSFYRARWREPGPGDQGRFVARRPQAFGVDLWCFAEIANGIPTRIIDLPIASALARGSDEAWRLQAALDATAGHPQRLRLRGSPESPTLLDLFSPPPSWSQRRLDIVGTPAPRSGGALFSYALPEADVDDEAAYLEGMMWCSVETATGPTDS